MADQPVFVLSRTDSIGDVVLTLPMAGFIKTHALATKVFFWTYLHQRRYWTEFFVDGFINYDELETLKPEDQKKTLVETGVNILVHVLPQLKIARFALKALAFSCGLVPQTGHHWFNCNKLVKLSRKILNATSRNSI